MSDQSDSNQNKEIILQPLYSTFIKDDFEEILEKYFDDIQKVRPKSYQIKN
jgi:hypothetical protein